MTNASPTILVVEDEQVVALDLEVTLTALGFRVVSAHTGPEAVAQARRHRPDLVLMDIRLHGESDGVTAATTIRAYADIPIIYLTAYSDEATRWRVGTTAPYGYLIKPFDERTLQTTIEMTLIRHAHDQQLRAREEWFRTTLASIGDGIVTTDAQATVTYLNGVASDLLGLPATAAVGRPVAEIFPLVDPDTGAQVVHPVVQALEQATPVALDDDLLLHRVDGQKRWIADSAAPIQLGSAPPLGAVMVFRDASARRAAEQERLQRQQRQQELEHLERLRVLSGGIAHDLNNLLTGLLGYTQLARLEAAAPPIGEALDQIEMICERAGALTQQLLAYAGRARLAVVPVDLNQLVADVVGALRSTLLRDVPVTMECDPALPPVAGDQAQLHQIVLNLVVNAAEACAAGDGTIAITTSRRDLAATAATATLTGGALAAGRYVALEVADTGPGMDQATCERIFEPFFTTKFTGRGLGLATVLGNLRAHGGTVEVRSALGAGTSFTVLLPALDQPPVRPVAPLADAGWRGEGIMLVIDDEAAVRTVAQRLLQQLGFTVVTASSGAAGLAAFRRQPEPVRGVLLDLTMPGLHGVEVAARLRAIDPDVPILLMSGYSQDDVAGLLQQSHAIGFLAKPFTLAGLRRELQQLIPSLAVAQRVGGA